MIVKKTLAKSWVAASATPLSLFGCSTTLLGHVYWCATDEQKSAWHVHMAGSSDAEPALNGGSLRRLQGYQEQEHGGTAVRICDLNQTAEFAGRWCQLVPCLLRRCGSIWCQEHQRCLLPPETLLVMGWPMCGVSKLHNRLSFLNSPDSLPAGVRAREIFFLCWQRNSPPCGRSSCGVALELFRRGQLNKVACNGSCTVPERPMMFVGLGVWRRFSSFSFCVLPRLPLATRLTRKGNTAKKKEGEKGCIAPHQVCV